MKIVQLVPHVSEEASGPSYTVTRLCEAQAALGHDVELTCLAAGRPLTRVRLDVHPEWPVLRRFALSPSLAFALRRKAAEVDVVHNNSLWSMVNVAAGWAVIGRRAKLVTSPRGTLSPWALNHSRRKKALLRPLQWRALTHADLLHATSEDEFGAIRAAGLTAPVALIPNGVDLPSLETPVRARSGRTVLYLSRIHPVKGLDRLLAAWANLELAHPEWRLLIAGVGPPEYERLVKNLAASLGLQRVEFPGPIYGAAKSQAYLDADLFVLPTHSENFGVVVAEALAHECPAIVGKGAPWSGLESEGCGWWTDNDVSTLTATLRDAMNLPASTLSAMGARGRLWMARDYGWDAIAAQMVQAYRWLLDGGRPPECVRIS